jgi:hypothetical protein
MIENNEVTGQANVDDSTESQGSQTFTQDDLDRIPKTV